MSSDDKEAEAALKMFHELTEQGCSLRDIVVAIYHQGRHDALGKPPAPRPAAASVVPICPYDEILDIYHAILCDPKRDAKLARVKTFDKGRKDAIRKFWVWIFTSTKIGADGTRSNRATNRQQGMDWIRRYCELAFQHDHTMGRGESRRGYESWDPGIEYAFRPDTVKKIIEHTRRPTNGQHYEGAQS
jgi:hypothetical protein